MYTKPVWGQHRDPRPMATANCYDPPPWQQQQHLSMATATSALCGNSNNSLLQPTTTAYTAAHMAFSCVPQGPGHMGSDTAGIRGGWVNPCFQTLAAVRAQPSAPPHKHSSTTAKCTGPHQLSQHLVCCTQDLEGRAGHTLGTCQLSWCLITRKVIRAQQQQQQQLLV
jgi:hypothetical protein